MRFEDFCRVHGLLVQHLEVGRWVRVATEDHPRKRNGAYKFLGDIGWVQNHATMVKPEAWRPERDEVAAPDMARIRRAAERELARQRERQQRAVGEADRLIRSCQAAKHPYLEIKGFADERGLVAEDGALVVPMRHWRTNALVGAQTIRWLEAERRYEKRMLPGTRAKGAMLALGRAQEARSWLVEGYATGLSVRAALRLMRVPATVVVAFSAGNLAQLAEVMPGASIFADNDVSATGERVARASGRPWVMSPTVGEDANDMHKRAGIYKVAALMRAAMTG